LNRHRHVTMSPGCRNEKLETLFRQRLVFVFVTSTSTLLQWNGGTQ